MQLLARAILGGISGTLATFPMTVAMSALHRRLPPEEKYPLPPRLITMNLASRTGMASEMDEQERYTVTLAAHYGYGFGMGLLYGALVSDKTHPVTKGIAFGLTVWTVSYLGLLPAIGLFRPATQQPMRRNALMIAAHVVWGAAFGLLQSALQKRRRRKIPFF